jgi:hypothetical protein
MGWLSNKINQWAGDKQEEELRQFLEMLRSMDGSELGLVAAGVTHMRHALELEGHNVMDPIVYTTSNPTFAMQLSNLVRECQKQGRMQDAASLMVWLHTMRAGIRLELRGLAREMWGQLARGFPHIHASAAAMRGRDGQPLSLAGATQFPAGFSPQPK